MRRVFQSLQDVERFFQFRDENRGRYYIVGEAEWIYGGGRGGNAS